MRASRLSLSRTVCLVLLALARISNALDPSKAITQYVHETWRTDQGLPMEIISTICQTPDGYLWIGTQDGSLARFDGVRFTVFDSSNTPGLGGGGAPPPMDSLYVDRSGSLWIGTEGVGLYRFKDSRFTAFTKKEGLSNDLVHSLHEDREGNLWIGTLGGGLNRFKDGKFTAITTKDGLPNDFIYAIQQDRQGRLWIGTGRGLSRLEDGKLVTFTTKDGLPNDEVFSILEDREGNLWVGTAGGLARLTNGKFTAFTTKDGLSNDSLRSSLLEDHDGSLWFGTRGGLNRFRDGKFTAFTTKDGLAHDEVVALHEDREGSLWIGTGGGLERLRDGKFTPFGPQEGLSSESALSIYEDRQGSLWVGTAGGGLNRFRDGKFIQLAPKEGMSNAETLAICEDREGSLWFGTGRGSYEERARSVHGLGRLRGGELTVFTTEDGLSGNGITSIHEDREGSLWIGTAGKGLNKLKDGKFTVFTTKQGLSHDSVSTIHEDHEGTLWIGTFGGGLNSLRNGAFVSHGPKGLSVASIHEDGDSFWLGTQGGGLNRFKDGRFIAYTTKQGLPQDLVYKVLEDDLGDLWVSCDRGIFRVHKRELNAFADGKIDKLSVTTYGTADGMRSRECFGGTQNAGARTRDGRLWFPTTRGVVMVDPAHMPFNRLPPPVMLEEVLVDKKTLDRKPGARIALQPGIENVEFHYTANSLRVPRRVKFKYRLEGFDKEWVDAGTERIAHYTNLPPRSYTFHVIACNDDEVWNEKGASFVFTLRPHFWQTWWLQALTALGVLGASLAFQRRRLDKRKTRELAETLRSAELARKTEELEHARRVQLALLPKEALTVGAWTVAGRMQTATEVGGDYFGYFEARGKLCVVVGDATGHGMASGLVAGMLKSALAALSQTAVRSEGPAQWLSDLNSALRESIAQRGLGVCLGIALVDVETGTVELGIAGIPHPFHVRASGAVERLPLSGTPLGYLKRIATATATRTLAPGDRLVLMTDGVIEQVDPTGEEWGYAGVESALAVLCPADVTPERIAQGLIAACERYGTGQPRSDDRTVVVLSRQFRGGAARAPTAELR